MKPLFPCPKGLELNDGSELHVDHDSSLILLAVLCIDQGRLDCISGASHAMTRIMAICECKVSKLYICDSIGSPVCKVTLCSSPETVVCCAVICL